MTEVSSKRSYAKSVKPLSRADKNQRTKMRGDARNKVARSEAEARFSAWNTLSAPQKLAALDARLGKGIGAVSQRARLNAVIQAEVEAAKLAAAKKAEQKPKKKNKK